MKTYKIGVYHYEEIDEQSWNDILDLGYKEEKEHLVTLVDYDGEPFKFFKRVRK